MFPASSSTTHWSIGKYYLGRNFDLPPSFMKSERARKIHTWGSPILVLIRCRSVYWLERESGNPRHLARFVSFLLPNLCRRCRILFLFFARYTAGESSRVGERVWKNRWRHLHAWYQVGEVARIAKGSNTGYFCFMSFKCIDLKRGGEGRFRLFFLFLLHCSYGLYGLWAYLGSDSFASGCS